MDAKSILRILFNIPLFFLTMFLALAVSLDSTMQISISFGFESDTLYYNLFWILYWVYIGSICIAIQLIHSYVSLKFSEEVGRFVLLIPRKHGYIYGILLSVGTLAVKGILSGKITLFWVVITYSLFGLLNIIIYIPVLLSRKAVRYTNHDYTELTKYGVNTILSGALGHGPQPLLSFTKFTKMPPLDKYEKYLVNGTFITIYMDYQNETAYYPCSPGSLHVKVTKKDNEEKNITIHSLHISSSQRDDYVEKDDFATVENQKADLNHTATVFIVTTVKFPLSSNHQETLTILLDIEIADNIGTERKVIECKLIPTVENGLIRVFSESYSK